MDTQEILKRVRKIEIKARGLSNNIFAGQYHSAFKGRGMAFSEVREYQYGDDIRDIDWNVSARFHKPYVKVYEEERELTVMLLIDVSGSLDIGTQNATKREVVTDVTGDISRPHRSKLQIDQKKRQDKILLRINPNSQQTNVVINKGFDLTIQSPLIKSGVIKLNLRHQQSIKI